MKASRFSNDEIVAILKQAEAGSHIPALCLEHGISSSTFYNWRARFGSTDAPLRARNKELEDENGLLKKMYVEVCLRAEILAEELARMK